MMDMLSVCVWHCVPLNYAQQALNSHTESNFHCGIPPQKVHGPFFALHLKMIWKFFLSGMLQPHDCRHKEHYYCTMENSFSIVCQQVADGVTLYVSMSFLMSKSFREASPRF